MCKLQYDETINLKDNAMLKHSSHLFDNWNFKKNDELGLNVYLVTYGSHKNVWWCCDVCEDTYPMSINKKTSGRGCSVCSGYYVTKKNSFGGKHPEIAKEWNYELNGNKSPYEFSVGSGERVWWACLDNEKHTWITSINNRRQGTGCPFCAGKEILKGFNDFWTTHPEKAKLLINSEDGYKYSYGNSKNKVKWQCTDCEHVNTNTINELSKNVGCKTCSDAISLGEKIIYSLLELNNIDFRHEHTFKWSQNKRYDFYIPSLSTIIEVHGEQHYFQTNRVDARTLAEEQENDKFKYEIALKNNIQNYITIDARHSNFEWIKNEVINSKLLELLDSNAEDFELLDLKTNSFTINTWKLWNEGFGVMYISKKLKISKSAVKRYLILGNSLKKCVYTVEGRYEKVKKVLLKLNMNGEIIEKYTSLIEAKNGNPHKSLQVTKYPFTIIKKTDNHIWVYEEEYLKNKNIFKESLKTYQSKTNICQLDTSLNLIAVFESVVDASEKNNFNYSNIIAACKNRKKTYHGFKWMYKEDYENIIKNKIS